MDNNGPFGDMMGTIPDMHSSEITLYVNPYSGIVVNSSEPAQVFYGYSQIEFQSVKILDLIALADNGFFSEILNVDRKDAATFQAIHYLKSGEIRFAEIRTLPINSPTRKTHSTEC